MDPSETPAALPARRNPSGEHDAGMLAVLDAVNGLSRKVDKVMERLADGTTRLALHDERLMQIGAQLAALGARVEKQGARQEEFSASLLAVTCDDCEERIDTLEAKESQRADREDQAAKASARQPAWWVILILTPILTTIGTAAAVWFIRGIAPHAGTP